MKKTLEEQAKDMLNKLYLKPKKVLYIAASVTLVNISLTYLILTFSQ